MDTLKYVPFSSCLDASFLHELNKNKLEVYGLDETPVKIQGFYSNSDADNLPPRLTLEFNAFERAQTPPRCITSTGELILKNTKESFKDCDKKALMDIYASRLWDDIKSGDAESDPTLLNKFFLLMYADMKKYHFYSWFAFPAICFPADTLLTSAPVSLDESNIRHLLIPLQDAINRKISEEVSSGAAVEPYFIVCCQSNSVTLHSIQEFPSLCKQNKVLLAFRDPSTDKKHPGWPLRNLLTMAAVRWSQHTLNYEVLCLRDRVQEGQQRIGHSLVLSVQLTKTDDEEPPNFVGWEKNERGKLGPRLLNLSSSMDPLRLIDSSVDLNLKLMKWRLAPSIDLQRIKRTRCLLIGAGTLGCNVARSLLGWGVRQITFVDNGKVSYSNPVRQSLFKFEDCVKGGKLKAETAAAALQEIFPGVRSKGINLSIPMPGHSIPEAVIENVQKDVEILVQLIDEHDVIFLLTDTRESRWLPSLIAASKRKLVINAALGFDTFLVMRHGLKADNETATSVTENGRTTIPGHQLGCYFCNDVVAPGNVGSTQDRTLDQQCTVTRPGMSMMAASLAVELMASVLQYPTGGLVPAIMTARDDHMSLEPTTVLGIVPHQIRGFVSWYYQVLPASTSFDKCTACSNTIIEAYETKGFEFLVHAFNDPSYLEDITGLTELHIETQAAEVWELDDDDD